MKYIIAIITSIIISSCGPLPSGSSTASDSGIQKKTVAVTTDANGWSVEQKNVAERLKIDNLPGSIKHLYIISPYSGQTIIYSTVRGKVTSGGKRLSPTTVEVSGGGQYASRLRGYDFGSRETAEVLQDDGTYGSSAEYIFWWDTKGFYHQHFFTGGQIIHVSDQPLPVKEVIINVSNQTLK